MRRRFFTLAPILALVLSLAAEGWAAPTLARLSFWVPPKQMAEFETAYQEKVVPILKQHGLVESSERGRTNVEGIFSRLFEMKTPAEVEDKGKALGEDTEWQEVLQHLGIEFGTTQPGDQIQYRFGHYSTPVGTGRVVSAGSGEKSPAGRGQGHWRTYDVMDGLASGDIYSIYQDKAGNLWFGTDGCGVSRYDGITFTTFTTKDGLVNNWVASIYQDKAGYLWFGTGGPWGGYPGGGVSRYDGHHFTTFTKTDGLAGNTVLSILQDKEGHLWFGGSGGISRYNGHQFTTFTVKDGLAENIVLSILQDREGYLWFGTFSGGVGTFSGGVSRYDGVTFTTFSTQDGLAANIVCSIYQDREGHLWFGTVGGGVSQYDGVTFTTFTTEDGLGGNWVSSMLEDREGYIWFGSYGGGVSRYDGHHFTTFTTEDGLKSNQVHSIWQDSEGHLWFGTDGGSVSRYDGQHFTTFTTKDGLADNLVWPMLEDREGYLWFGTHGGVSRYDGMTFTTFTTKNGLAENVVLSILQDREGHLWFGTFSGGVSRYDGVTFTTFTTKDGLAGNLVHSIWQDKEDYLWFGTGGGGVSRYDGITFTTFTTEDGLRSNQVHSIWQDSEGHLWFGTSGGVSRYDGQHFTTFTTKDGLADNEVRPILQDREGHLWFGTDSGGVSRYANDNARLRLSDGHIFTNFTRKDRLGDNQVRSIFQDKEGHLWFGGHSGVISRYDGQVFQTLTHHDGLTGGSVKSILQDGEGNIWFGTYTGVVRYRPPEPSPPTVFMDAVVADRRYQDISEVTIPSSVRLVAFEFHGTSFKTRPEAMVYRYRLKSYDADWQNTNSRRVEYQDIPQGSYSFEVIAVDRDLVYSESRATVKLKIVPPFYLRTSFLAPIIGFGTILLATLVILATALIKRRRQVHAYQRAAVLELQDAREMQMSLMPESAPSIEGVEIAGKCVPANTVSGDFFDYLEGKRPHEIALVVADVMGKAMKGAMNAMMTSGILRMAAKGQEQLSPSSLMMEINDVLKSRTERLMNVTMVIGVIDVANKILTIANAGILPLLLRHGKVLTLKLGDLPLGMISGIKYTEEQFPLQSSDVVILMTDGIIEVQNSDEQFYSDSGRLEETIGKFTLDLSAEAMVDAILNDAMNFGGDKTQRDDDMTVVVAKIQ